MYYYSKITGKKNINEARNTLVLAGGTDDNIVLDCEVRQKSEHGTYENMKKALLEKGGCLTVDALTSLGKNNREIAKELCWFKDNNIEIRVIDLPSFNGSDKASTELLYAVYENLANAEKENVKTAQAEGIRKALDAGISYGRHKIEFPEGFGENYVLWEKGDITATEFMKRVNMKKGTFYRMVKDYKNDMSLKELDI